MAIPISGLQKLNPSARGWTFLYWNWLEVCIMQQATHQMYPLYIGFTLVQI